MGSPRNVVDLLRDLVAIPSVNPDGNPGTDLVGEAGMVAYLADFLGGLGATVSRVEVEPGRENLFATFEPEGKVRRRLAFAPHTDTVSVAGMTIPPFDPQVRGGKIYGRGTSDTKGSMAAMLWAIRGWAKSRGRAASGLHITFAGLMGEEAGLVGASHWAQSKPDFDLAIIGEPTSMRVVHAFKGPLWLKLIAKGRACHAATPDRGRNAILLMARALRVVEERVAPALAKGKHPLLGRTSLSVGIINGGSKVNIVPDLCEAHLDIRRIPGQSRTEVLKLIRAELRAADLPVTVQVAGEGPALDVDPKHPLVAELADALRGTAVAPWICDAAMVAGPGRPAVAAGPGSIDQAHTRDEWIRVADLEQGAELFADYLRRPLP